jgi:hypothetical protein
MPDQGREPWGPEDSGSIAAKRNSSGSRFSRAAVFKGDRTSSGRQPCGAKNAGLERRAGAIERVANLPLEHLQEPRRNEVEHPSPEALGRREIFRERADLPAVQVDQESLRDDERSLRPRAEPGKKRAPRGHVRKIEPDALEGAARPLLAQDGLLVTEDPGQVHLDPGKRRVERHPVRAGVEAGGEVDDHVGALRDLLRDETVEEDRAHDPGPGVPIVPLHLRGDRVAPRARESLR